MLGALNFSKTIRYNNKLNTTEGVANYIEKQYRNDNGEFETATCIKVNEVYFNIPKKYQLELKDKNVRLYYFNNEDAVVVAVKYLD